MNEITSAGITIQDSTIVHNSALRKYRSPLGAVSTGSRVTLRLSLNDINYERACLIVLFPDGAQREFLLENKDGFSSASVDVPIEECVLWYWFRVDVIGGSCVYYGAQFGGCSGVGKVYSNPPPSFQLTVFADEFRTPDWTKGIICYQIFPDRFCMHARGNAERGIAAHHAMGRTGMRLHGTWNELPDYLPAEGEEHYEPLDLFGGDLAGIVDELPRLAALGVGLLYLNPIFDAASNHRYNTGDYLNVDPVLGTIEDFENLVEAAKTYNMRIILDGVFSHTGDDSVYFNKYGRYDSTRAYQSKESPYFSWYRFSDYPDHYDSWWGFGTLPEVNERDASWIDFVVYGEKSVLNTWLERGASGYRLDVADELPDETICQMREAIKTQNPNSFLVGEVWEDATIKQSYNMPRKYALGHGLDSVMNYPLTRSIIDFLLGHMDSFAFKRFLEGQSQNYPKEMYHALMNLLSSHDAARIRTVLAGLDDTANLSREEQAHVALNAEQSERSKRLHRLAAALQFAVPGMPTIYYGDEVGMTGLLDPFNRKPFAVEDAEFESEYRKLAEMRENHSVMKTGSVLFYATNGEVLGVLRHSVRGADAFGNPMEREAILTLVNHTERTHKIVIDLMTEKECMPEEDIQVFQSAKWMETQSLLTGNTTAIRGGLLELDIGPYDMEICELLFDV